MAGLMGGGEQDNLLLEYLMEMGALQPEQQGLDRQRMMVEALRGQSQIPQGTLNPGGRLRPAQSPLAMIAPLIGQGVAGYQERGINQSEKALKTQRTDALGRLRSKLGGGAQTAAFPQQPMPGEDTQPY
jgi:hypothetical protein